MSFSQAIAAQNRPAKRPSSAEALLLHPIAADPRAAAATMDEVWAKEHAAKPRFYIGGIDWFKALTGRFAEDIAMFRQDAVLEAATANWPSMPGTPDAAVKDLKELWGSIAKPQYYESFGARRTSFPKSALFIISCEIALERWKADARQKRPIPDTISGASVYQNMAIVPACWNINDFNMHYFSKHFGNATLLEALRKHVGQDEMDLYTDLASGFTVTFDTAYKVKEFCMNRKLGVLGEIRSKAGRALGRKKASKSEMPHL